MTSIKLDDFNFLTVEATTKELWQAHRSCDPANYYVPYCIALNPNAGQELLNELSKIPNTPNNYIQTAIAQNKNTSKELLSSYSQIEDQAIQVLVLNNPNTDSADIVKLTNSIYPKIQKLAESELIKRFSK